MRIESALFVKRVRTKFDQDGDWLGFERLTCVPIQTKMVKDALLTKEERQWIKVCRSFGRYVVPWLTGPPRDRTTTAYALRSSNHT